MKMDFWLLSYILQLGTMEFCQRFLDVKVDPKGRWFDQMTQERLAALKQNAITEGAPTCPKCGAPMRKRMIKKGIHQGEEFWGCTEYPRCDGTRRL